MTIPGTTIMAGYFYRFKGNDLFKISKKVGRNRKNSHNRKIPTINTDIPIIFIE